MAQLSVIIISPDGCATVRRLVDCLSAQTVRHELELVFVLPPRFLYEVKYLQLEGFAAVQIVASEATDSTARARAAGIAVACSPIIALTEDHSFPDPDWAEALIRAHRNGWAIVGPAVRNGNPWSLLSWTNFLIEYSEWLDPAAGGEVHHLPGHNSAYKRDILHGYGADLSRWLEAESLLHWDLHARGYRLFLEPAARTRHLNFSRFGSSISLRFQAGRLFAGMRRRGWRAARRMAYAAASPLIPFIRLVRIVRALGSPGRPLHLVPRLLPAMLVLLGIDAFGEMAGYLLGPGDSSRYIARIDFHRENFMNRRDRARWAES
jgi:hypothetical protein